MNEIYISGIIGRHVTAPEIREQLDAIGDEDVLVRINSAGGSFADGPAIYSYLKQHGGKVTTQVDGIAYSMGAIVAQAGNVRRAAKNAVLMVHGARTGANGNASAEELRETATAMDAHTRVMANILEDVGIVKEVVSEWMFSGRNFYFSADDAQAAGLIDQVSPAIDLAAALREIPEGTKHPAFLAALIAESPLHEDPTMPTENIPETVAPSASGVDVQELMTKRDKQFETGRKSGAKAEFQRQQDIRALFEPPKFQADTYQELMNACLDDASISADDASKFLLKAVGEMYSPEVDQAAPLPTGHEFPVPGHGRQPTAVGGHDQIDKFLEGAEKALMISAQVDKVDWSTMTEEDRELRRKERNTNEFLSMRPTELAREFLKVNRARPSGFSKEDIIASAMMLPPVRSQEFYGAATGHTGSDFSHLLSNVANKALLRGFQQDGETWRGWCSVGTLPDFKEADLVNVSLFDDLKEVGPSGEYRHGTMEDIVEKTKLRTYGALFGITRVALANDDLRALGQTPMKMGLAAARMVGDVAYNILTSNPIMDQDGVALFDAAHNNIGSAAAISVMPGGSLDAMVTAMRTQKDPAGIRLNIRARRLVVPAALEISTSSTIADATIRDTGAAQEMRNPFRDRLTVHADARLDDVSTTGWYLLADQNINDTVEVLFLNGQEEPFMDSKEGWTRDGIEYKVRIDVVAKALDFRTIAKNDGA